MREPTDLKPLFPQERRVVNLVAEGLRDKAIAYRMNLVIGTIKRYVVGALAKTGCESRTELILWVYREMLDTEEESRL